MKIGFYGASGSVTGSCHYLEVSGKKILLDCGLYQGRDMKERGNDRFEFNPAEIDYLILSHAHIDHSGRIPMLYKQGFRGQIICTPPTGDLSEVMLMDSAKIQEQDAARINRKKARAGQKEIEPLYTMLDAQKSMEHFLTLEYDKKMEIFPGLSLTFTDSGHMLGSAYTTLDIKEEGKEDLRFVYSGDVGNHNIPLLREPGHIDSADLLLMEATYGNRLHQPPVDENDRFIEIINSTVRGGGNVVIPSFAVGRTQEILYILNDYAEKGLLDKNVKVYVDSPLATKATQIFSKYQSYMDSDAQKRIKTGDDILKFEGLRLVESTEDSMRLNDIKSGSVIISASGMADAGRVRHHLKHNLWRPECSVIFVGYQAEGTLGKDLISGVKNVRITGENISVQAKIYQMGGLSGHADRNGLLEIIDNMRVKPIKTYLIHGDDPARMSLAKDLEERNLNVSLARYMQSIEINSKEDLNTPAEVIDQAMIDAGNREPLVTDDEASEPVKIDNRSKIMDILNKKDINRMSKEELLRFLNENL